VINAAAGALTLALRISGLSEDERLTLLTAGRRAGEDEEPGGEHELEEREEPMLEFDRKLAF
jgi:hypothetical protein